MLYQAAVYGDFSVKFRMFGVDLGVARRSISLDQSVRVEVPFRLPAALPLRFQRFGISVDAWVAPV